MSTTTQFLIQPAPNTSHYPVGDSFNLVLDWRKADAGQAALNKNAILAADWLNTGFGNWLANYATGRLSWDANPPAPPTIQWAYATATTEDNGALSFTYSLVDSPLGTPVCAIPTFTRLPKPQGGTVSLMQLLSTEAGSPALPTITAVPVGQTAKDSAGNSWVRIS